MTHDDSNGLTPLDPTDEQLLVDRAVSLFRQGYNCSQAVCLAFATRYQIAEPLMARIAASFGGGIGRMRETCGAACGMFLLAGLEVTDADDSATPIGTDHSPYPSQQVKKRNYEVVQHLAAQFAGRTGSLLCRELLANSDKPTATAATPEQRTDDYYRRRPCTFMVETAVRVYCQYLRSKQ